jgi:hypothetical protein
MYLKIVYQILFYILNIILYIKNLLQTHFIPKIHFNQFNLVMDAKGAASKTNDTIENLSPGAAQPKIMRVWLQGRLLEAEPKVVSSPLITAI